MNTTRVRTVVVVDDSSEVRQLVRTLVASLGNAEVVGEAQDGVEAIELVRRQRPDVVVLDFSMPRMTGKEALVQIRELAPETKVVMYSSAPEMREECLDLGAFAYLEKTVHPEEVVATIRAASLAR